MVYKILLEANHTELVLDLLERNFSAAKDFCAILLPVETAIPRPKPDQTEPSERASSAMKGGRAAKQSRISRQELYDDIADQARVSNTYLITVVLSAVVAAIGIVKGNIAVIIGAMVITPLLGPNVSLSLATALGDLSLARQSLEANIAGVSIAFACSVSFGWLVPVNPSMPEIASRTAVDLSDIGLALASGAAGALAFTSGISTAVIGVMVAVALLPPLVACGCSSAPDIFRKRCRRHCWWAST